MNYETTLKKLISVARKKYNKKISIANYMRGSTIFVSKYPKFWIPYHQNTRCYQDPTKVVKQMGRHKNF